MRWIKKKSEDAKIPEDVARDIILWEHEIFKLADKESLSQIEITLTSESWEYVNRITENLQVSVDAVVSAGLMTFIKMKEKGEV